MKEFITYLIPVATALIGYLFAAKKNNAETNVLELEAVEKAVRIWRELAGDLKKEVEELRKQVNELIEENQTLTEEINKLKNDR